MDKILYCGSITSSYAAQPALVKLECQCLVPILDVKQSLSTYPARYFMPQFLSVERPLKGSYIGNTGGDDGYARRKVHRMDMFEVEESAMLAHAVTRVSENLQEHFTHLPDWLHHMKNGHRDSITSLVLCLLPNLEELEIYDYGSRGKFLSHHPLPDLTDVPRT